MKNSVTVVKGEASESDEEQDMPGSGQNPTVGTKIGTRKVQKPGAETESQSEKGGVPVATATATLPTSNVTVSGHSLQTHKTAIPSPLKQKIMTQSIVVSGEASESSEEEMEIDTSAGESNLTPLQVNQTERGDSVDLSSENDSRSSSRLSQLSDREPELKYDTLLHGKLRERNASLRRHLCDSLGQVYLSSAREIRSMTQGLLRSQAAIQDVSHNMGLLTNNLFHLEDKIDIIASCNLLPVIDISPIATPTSPQSPPIGHLCSTTSRRMFLLAEEYGRSIFALLVLSFLQITQSTVSTSVKMMRAAQFEAGGPELLSVGQAPIPDLKPNEVLVKVYTTAVNRADTLQRKGKYSPPSGSTLILGLEAAGRVERISAECTKWSIGDRVMALVSGGGNAEYVAVHQDHLMPIPNGMNFTEAGAIPEVWLTAYQLLHLVGQVRSGDRVLIHAGGSGVGTAAVQLTRLAGAEPIVTAGSQAKIDKALSLGAKHGFNYKEGAWLEKVMEATGGHGADVILDCVGGSFWEQNVGALAVDGRWVSYGLLGGGRVEGDILSRLLRKRGTLVSTLLRPRSNSYKAELVAAFVKTALPHFISGGLKTVIDCTMPFDQISAAHTKMEANTNSGKIVLVVRTEQEAKSEL